ncbi:NAD(P)-dependent oxidoreductase [Alistipes sp.]|uniref:NAD(P)-dependent oxidoreductase n=1 Tax=Alistipes sp. TaxID=1872444 RepID=UPI0030777BD5
MENNTKKPTIVFLDEYTLGGADLRRIKALGDYTGYENTTREEVIERCRTARVVITNKVVLDRETLRALPSLRLICVAATGLNNIDLEAAAELGIEVRNAAGYSTHSVAETTLGAAIALLRHSVYYDRYVKSGAYASSGRQFHFALANHQLHGSRWGIVGLGTIGHEVARLAEAFGCEVRYTSTSGVAREERYPALSLAELLSWADVVSIHCPLNARTRNLIGAPELKIMKRSAILINVARGGIVDEAALATALDRGSIAGAALDVFTQEPLAADNPLTHIAAPDRILLSPHNAWSPVEAVEVLVGCIERNITEFCNRQ